MYGETVSYREVELLKNGSELETAYIAAWKGYYGEKPPLTEEDRTVLRWLAQVYPLTRSKQLLGHYLTMKTDWFLQNGHSLACLKKNLITIMGSLMLVEKRKGHSTGMELAEEADSLAWYLANSSRVLEAHGLKKIQGVVCDNEGVPIADIRALAESILNRHAGPLRHLTRC